MKNKSILILLVVFFSISCSRDGKADEKNILISEVLTGTWTVARYEIGLKNEQWPIVEPCTNSGQITFDNSKNVTEQLSHSENNQCRFFSADRYNYIIDEAHKRITMDDRVYEVMEASNNNLILNEIPKGEFTRKLTLKK